MTITTRIQQERITVASEIPTGVLAGQIVANLTDEIVWMGTGQPPPNDLIVIGGGGAYVKNTGDDITVPNGVDITALELVGSNIQSKALLTVRSLEAAEDLITLDVVNGNQRGLSIKLDADSLQFVPRTTFAADNAKSFCFSFANDRWQFESGLAIQAGLVVDRDTQTADAAVTLQVDAGQQASYRYWQAGVQRWRMVVPTTSDWYLEAFDAAGVVVGNILEAKNDLSALHINPSVIRLNVDASSQTSFVDLAGQQRITIINDRTTLRGSTGQGLARTDDSTSLQVFRQAWENVCSYYEDNVAPSVPVLGQIWRQPSSGDISIWVGSWVKIGPTA